MKVLIPSQCCNILVEQYQIFEIFFFVELTLFSCANELTPLVAKSLHSQK